MYYNVTCKRDELSTAVQLLADVAVAPAFKPWELETLTRRLILDLELLRQNPSAQLVEALHKAAYRDSLGRSLFMSADRIGTFSPENLENFVKSHHVSGNVVVAGVGVNQEELVKFASKMHFSQGSTPASDASKAKYHGGELRVETRNKLVHAAIVTEGMSLSSGDLLTASLLGVALGTTPLVQYSSGVATSKLNKAISAATKSDFAASYLNAMYSDSGLFGVQVVANSQEIGKVLKAVVGAMGQLTKTGLTDQELQTAKRKLKASLRLCYDDGASTLEGLAAGVLIMGDVIGQDAVDKSIDAISLDAVNKVAKKIINGKPTLAAVGDLSNTPYLDELL
jgi:ubiquinol-cytochrome c reductase core subunit 2